jgi:hypothetical protein
MKMLAVAIVTLAAGLLVGAPARADIIRARPGGPPRFNVMDATPPLGRFLTPKALKSFSRRGRQEPKGFRQK